MKPSLHRLGFRGMAFLLIGTLLVLGLDSFAQSSVDHSEASIPGPDIRLRDAAGNRLKDYQSLPFGADLLTRTAYTMTVTIENPGDSPLIVTPSRRNDLDDRLSVISTPQAPIPPGTSATLTIQFLTNTPGTFTEGVLQLLSNATPLVGIQMVGADPPRPANPYLKFSATARAEHPAVTSHPASNLIGAGHPYSLNVQAEGLEVLQYAWTKDDVPLSESTSNLAIAAMTSADVGAYRVNVSNGLGAELSGTAYVGLITPPAIHQLHRPGDNVLLSVSTTLPPGCTAEYYWRKNHLLLSDGEGVSGANTSALLLTAVESSDEATYRWFVRVSAPDGGTWLQSGLSHLEVEKAPEFVGPLSHHEVEVGSFFSHEVKIKGSVTTSKVTGLPSGLSWHPDTRTLSGVPTVARLVKGLPQPFLVRCTAVNEYGATSADVLSITILPSSGDGSGAYSGLVERHADLNANLGGTLNMVILKSGSLTGKLTLGARTYPFRSSQIRYHGGDTGGVVSIPRPSPLPRLILRWTRDQEITATVTAAGTENSVACRAAPAMAESDRKLHTGFFTAAMVPSPGKSTEAPQGSGFCTLSVRPSGVVAWAGKLADGSSLTFSSALAQDGHASLHVLLHNKTGSIQGTGAFDHGPQTVDGVVDWFKSPQPLALRGRNYPGGWPVEPVIVIGGRYQRPSPGQFLLGAHSPKSTIAIDHPALSEGILQSFSFTERHSAIVPANANSLRISLNPATGLFSGGFNTTNATRNIKRSGTFNGIIVNRLGAGVGHVLLPAFPTAGQSPYTTPILSGSVEIKTE